MEADEGDDPSSGGSGSDDDGSSSGSGSSSSDDDVDMDVRDTHRLVELEEALEGNPKDYDKHLEVGGSLVGGARGRWVLSRAGVCGG